MFGLVVVEHPTSYSGKMLELRFSVGSSPKPLISFPRGKNIKEDVLRKVT